MADDLKQIMDHVIAVLGTSEARLYDEVNSSFNWLLATLFAANGGAVVAIVSRDTLAYHIPLTFFAVGVIFSILMGMGKAFYAAKAIIPMTDLKMTFATFVAGQASFEQVQEKMSALDDFGSYKWAMYSAGGLSLAALIGGMLSFACAM
ncbi:hypothetical protein [Sphingobium sp. TKS]|uniref:hypothetical protein n=1 Tax=Sphingobium sp. TKS TaxID=1315974 RepID=UPI000770147D|nr:hypothetical protein [Sphingobium sp. TKS]AMK24366.1 hypothetical protein K426_17170 [Sphingobium sp. TKS]